VSNPKYYILKHYLKAVTTKVLYKIQLNCCLIVKPQQGSLIDRLLVEQMALDFSNGRSVSLHKFVVKVSAYYRAFYTYVYQEFISGGIENFEIYFQTPLKFYNVLI